MKTFYRILIVFFIVVALVLIALAGLIVARGGKFMNNGFFGRGNVEIVGDNTYTIEGLGNIDIGYISDSVNIYNSDSEDIRVVEYMSKQPDEDALTKVKTTSNSIEIKSGSRKMFFGYFISYVDIYLPKSFNGDLSIITTSGNIEVFDELTVKDCNISSVSGPIKCEKISGENLEVQTTSGSISLTEVNVVNDCNIQSTSGPVKSEKITGDTLKVQTTSGSIKLTEVDALHELVSISGSLNIESASVGGKYHTTSGSVTSNFTAVEKDITAESTSGDVRLTVPTGSFDFGASSTSGGIHTGFESDLEKVRDHEFKGTVGDSPTYNLKIKTTSGSIKVNY